MGQQEGSRLPFYRRAPGNEKFSSRYSRTKVHEPILITRTNRAEPQRELFLIPLHWSVDRRRRLSLLLLLRIRHISLLFLLFCTWPMIQDPADDRAARKALGYTEQEVEVRRREMEKGNCQRNRSEVGLNISITSLIVSALHSLETLTTTRGR